VWGPELPVVVARELTKIHEEFLRGTVTGARSELAGRDRIRGEITLLVETRPSASGTSPNGAPVRVSDRLALMQAEAGSDVKIDEKEALKRLAKEMGQSKSELYRELQRERARLR
jgi:16S rRNA (cytidine1402-2'-O)-methyltransferase